MSIALYSVARWNDTYENNRSRLVKQLTWVPVPNNHDGEAYARLMARKDAAMVFATWILILQVASRCDPRGELVRSNGEPHDFTSLSLKTRAPASWFAKSVPVLIETGWLVCKPLPENELALGRQDAAPSTSGRCDLPVTEGRKEGMERRKEGGAAETAPAPNISDSEFLETLRSNPAYRGIDVAREHAKMLAWCDVNKKQPSRRRFVNWLNRVERPMAPTAATATRRAGLNEPVGWREYVNLAYPESVYAKGGKYEHLTWDQLDGALQRKFVDEMTAKQP